MLVDVFVKYAKNTRYHWNHLFTKPICHTQQVKNWYLNSAEDWKPVSTSTFFRLYVSHPLNVDVWGYSSLVTIPGTKRKDGTVEFTHLPFQIRVNTKDFCTFNTLHYRCFFLTIKHFFKYVDILCHIMLWSHRVKDRQCLSLSLSLSLSLNSFIWHRKIHESSMCLKKHRKLV